MNKTGKTQKHFQLCIDQGNTYTKAGVFDGNNLIETFRFDKFTQSELQTINCKYAIGPVIISSVSATGIHLTQLFREHGYVTIELNHTTELPFQSAYKTPETLGKDRIAAVIGAAMLLPKSNILIIDAGTAITFDFIDSKGLYHGGNIAPGIDLRFKALHHFTGKLPLVEAKKEFNFLGYDTLSAILNGVLNGIIFEINGYTDALKIKYPELSVFLTGGSTIYFDGKLKSAIFVEKNLVLIGLNRILLFNVQK
ncbi:MAG: type III pantothenate kinase [Paludibacteraceae bacterium]|nr:type III pantothenate kinase [Paludibacteraceae bacterium]